MLGLTKTAQLPFSRGRKTHRNDTKALVSYLDISYNTSQVKKKNNRKKKKINRNLTFALFLMLKDK